MRHLNYNHLLYFWSVIREGGVAAAAAGLHITPQTISGQIKLLEEQLGGELFEKQGRRLVPDRTRPPDLWLCGRDLLSRAGAGQRAARRRQARPALGDARRLRCRARS